MSSKTIIPLSPRNQLLYITILLMKLRFLFTTLGHIKQQEVHAWHSEWVLYQEWVSAGNQESDTHIVTYLYLSACDTDEMIFSILFIPSILWLQPKKLKYLVKIKHHCLIIWSNNLCRNGQAMCIANLKNSRFVSNAPCAMLRTVNLWLCTDFARDRTVSTAVKGSLLSTILVAREWI